MAQTIEEALSPIFQQKITVYSSGRTDAGVHALNQVCHFDFEKPIAKKNWDFCWALNSKLPDSIAAKQAWYAPDDFHATLSATHKTYRYWVYVNPRPNVFLRNYAGWSRKPLDIQYLDCLAKKTIGTYDCKSLQSAGTPIINTVRTIYSAQWFQRSPHLLEFRITGNGFLKQMVRNIVGTHLFLEKHRSSFAEWERILSAKDRSAAGPVAEPQGLSLLQVYYPNELDNRCVEI
ncbi:MAG: tRNA pseudouridine synthase A [Pseudobdellovibrionaceae bacterium]